MKDYPIVAGIPMVILGLFLCFFGHAMLSAAIFVLTALVVTVVIARTTFSVTESISATAVSETATWVIALASLLIGVLVGSYMMYCIQLGVSIIAACGGFSFGQLLSDTFNVQSNTVYWIIIATCIIAAIAASCALKDTIIIISTSFMGSYLAIRGATLLIGGYPDPFSGQNKNIDWSFWLSIAIFAVLTGVAMIH